MNFYVDPELLQKERDETDLTNFPKGFLHWLESAKKEEKDLWYEERYKCRRYHLFLSGFTEAKKIGDDNLPPEYVPILGMDFQDNPHSQLFSQFLQTRPGENIPLLDLDPLTKKRMILWPRGLFKTSAIIVEIVQKIINYPNIRICFLTGGDQLAKRQLVRVKRVFEKPTKRFRWLFPEYCLVSKEVKKSSPVLDDEGKDTGKRKKVIEWEDVLCKMGTAHEFTVPCRNNDTFAEPTFAISTAKSVKAGSHYDMIVIDDLVNETNFRSVERLEKCYEDYIDICPILEPTGYIVMTGTRYSFGDTYERIQDMAREEEKKIGRSIWKFSIRDCWSWGCENCPHSSVFHDYNINVLQPPCTVAGCMCIGFHSNKSKGVLFPEVRTRDNRPIGHSLEFLEEKLREYGQEFFANQYENRPIATEAQVFTEALIGRQTIHDMRFIPTYADGKTFGVGDLAYVGEEGRDYSVIFMCRMYLGRIFVYDCYYGNWDAAAIADNTIMAIQVHKPEIMYFEKYNGWEAYNSVITSKAKERGLQKVPIEWVKGSQAKSAKVRRIGLSKGPLSNQRLWLFAGMRGYEQLSNQLIKWPKLGRHDDFADCLGMVCTAPTGYEWQTPPAPVSPLNWLNKLHQTEPAEDQYYDSGCGTGFCC